MNTPQEHGEPERREGLGGRVRRFVDHELSRVLNKDDKEDQRSDLTQGSDLTQEPTLARESDRHREPVNPYADAPVHADQPAMTTPVDPGFTTPAPDPGAEKVAPDRSSDQTAADNSAERVGLLNDPAGLREEWQQVQGTFVDDPQRAVHEASMLVDRTLQEIHNNVARGQTSDSTSTEDLRVSFQRYREFFQRLLSA
jgi:hypothetical protein